MIPTALTQYHGLFTSTSIYLFNVQNIQQIEGLESCLELKQLWLMENKISRIQGLDQLRGLRELYLYSNQLTTIDGLSKLTNLTVSSQLSST